MGAKASQPTHFLKFRLTGFRLSEINCTYNSVINYTCNEGYLINGSHSIVCLPYGNWNSAVPLCSRGEKLIIGVFACEIYVC